MEVCIQFATNVLTATQDEHVTLVQFHDNMAFFAVYDGHGGKEASRVSAERLHVVYFQRGCLRLSECVQHLLQALKSGVSIEEAFKVAYKLTDAEVCGTDRSRLVTDVLQLRERNLMFQGACSATCVVVKTPTGTRVYSANAGDSRVVLGY